MTSLEEPTQAREVLAPQRSLPAATDDDFRRPPRGFYARAWRTFRHDPVSLAATVMLGIIILMTLAAPLIAGQILHSSPEEIMRTPDGRIAILQPPGDGYPL